MTLYSLLADTLDPPTPEGWDWNPTPKQQQAIDASGQAFETLFGGSAAGGKSFAISNMAVDYALRHDGAHIGIVRKTLPMLKQTHLLTLRPMLQGVAVHNAAEMTWTFPNASIIRFISLPHAGEEQNYKSVEFDRLFFDEVTELPEEQYTYLLTRLRSARGHRVAAFCTANPEGVGYRWVKNRWVKDRTPGEVWHPPLPSGEPGPGRVFVPASVYDNPHILRTNPDYVRQLEAIPDPRKRAALLHGDWEAMSQVPGALWDLDVIERHRVTDTPQVGRVVVGVDPATTYGDNSDSTGIVVVGQYGQDLYVLADRTVKASPAGWAAEVLKACDQFGTTEVVAESNQGGEMVRHTLNEAAKAAMQTIRVRLIRASKGKAVRAEPVAALYELGKVHHYRTLPELEDELTTWTPDAPKSPDRLDALVWACTHLSGSGLGFTNY